LECPQKMFAIWFARGIWQIVLFHKRCFFIKGDFS